MPVRPLAALLAAATLLAGCAGGTDAGRPDAAATDAVPVREVSPPGADIDPPGGTGTGDEPADGPADASPSEVVLVLPIGTAPDGTELEVVARERRAAGRREVRIETPAGVVDHHVVDGDQHWWWIPPLAREAAGGVEWIHLDVAEARALGELPDIVAEARVPLPLPGQVEVGTVLAGHEVVAVDRRGPDEVAVSLVGRDEPALLTRRPLPAGARVRIPSGAVELRDLPEVLGR